MSLKGIDKLYKSAFRSTEYEYKDAYWAAMESKLGPKPMTIGQKLTRAVALSSAVMVMAVLVGDTQPQQNQSSNHLLANHTVELAETESTNSQIMDEESTVKNSIDEPLIVSTSPSDKDNTMESFESVNGDSNPTPDMLGGIVNSTEGITVVQGSNEVRNTAAIASQQEYSSDEHSINTAMQRLALEGVESGSETFNELDIKEIDVELLSHESFDEIRNNELIVSESSTFDISEEAMAVETEFGAKIKQSAKKQYFIQGGAAYYHLQHQHNPDIPENFKTTINTNNINGAEVLVGVKYKGLKLSTGIGFHSIAKNYAYDFETQEETFEKNQTVTKTFVGLDSTFIRNQVEEIIEDGRSRFEVVNTIYQVDSVYALQIDTNTITNVTTNSGRVALTYNLKYINIPIYIGYELPLNRFYVDIQTGVQLGYLTNYNGFKYSPGFEGQRSVVAANDLNRVTLNYHLSVGVGYHINPKISLAVQPSMTKSIIAPFKTIQPRSISGFGAKVALRYEF